MKLDHFREAAIGKFNSQVKDLLAPAYNPVNDEANVKNIAEIKATPEVARGTVINPVDGQPIV